MPPKVNVTLTIEASLVEDLDDLAEVRASSRSAEICTASKAWINEAIYNGELDRGEVWDAAGDHKEAVSHF